MLPSLSHSIIDVTFVLVVLYCYRYMGSLKNYMRFSTFFVLFSMGDIIIFVVKFHSSFNHKTGDTTSSNYENQLWGPHVGDMEKREGSCCSVAKSHGALRHGGVVTVFRDDDAR
uniref:Uncharacterized protein n=1 Tax=Oryza punctata TaxID=4537 RepID=A0A0E0LCH6_ORYPU